MSGLVVLTGASGLIGRAVRSALETHAYEVALVSREGRKRGLGSSFFDVDLANDTDGLVAGIPERPAAVVHLAALVPTALQPDTPENAVLTRRIDLAVLQAARGWGCPALYASGCSLYEPSGTDPKDEASRVVARSPYLAAKLEGESLFLALTGGGVARISSPYGIGLSSGVVLTKFLARAHADEVIEVWGDGTREQNFVHVDDVGRFVLRWLECRVGGVFNVASAEATTMRRLGEMVVSTVGKGRVEVKGNPDPLSGQTARFSISKAERILAWQPTILLRDGLKGLVTDAPG